MVYVGCTMTTNYHYFSLAFGHAIHQTILLSSLMPLLISNTSKGHVGRTRSLSTALREVQTKNSQGDDRVGEASS